MKTVVILKLQAKDKSSGKAGVFHKNSLDMTTSGINCFLIYLFFYCVTQVSMQIRICVKLDPVMGQRGQ